jgi:hypothetical protein
MQAMLDAPRSFIFSITLRVIQSSGQAEHACPLSCWAGAPGEGAVYYEIFFSLIWLSADVTHDKADTFYLRVTEVMLKRPSMYSLPEFVLE